jgi:hypothetical protein
MDGNAKPANEVDVDALEPGYYWVNYGGEWIIGRWFESWDEWDLGIEAALPLPTRNLREIDTRRIVRGLENA